MHKMGQEESTLSASEWSMSSCDDDKADRQPFAVQSAPASECAPRTDRKPDGQAPDSLRYPHMGSAEATGGGGAMSGAGGMAASLYGSHAAILKGEDGLRVERLAIGGIANEIGTSEHEHITQPRGRLLGPCLARMHDDHVWRRSCARLAKR